MSRLRSAIVISASFLLTALPCWAVTVQLDDGRLIQGDVVKVAGVAEDPTNPTRQNGGVRVEPILIIDDGLRRTYVNTRRVIAVDDADVNDKPIVIRLWQPYADRGPVIGRVGKLLGLTPFDEFGRRVYTMAGADGPLRVVQGITEVTPIYTRVRGLEGDPRDYVWDMRLATSSIPRETLARVLAGATPSGDLDARLEIVRLYLQSQRHRDAREELEAIARDFPDMQEELSDDIRQLRQLAARSLLDEIERREQAGQPQLARVLLQKFPGEGVAGATLERVREKLGDLDRTDRQTQKAIQLVGNAVDGIREPALQKVAREIQAEIEAELNEVSLPRMAAVLQLGEGDMQAEKLAAIAISSWLLGANQAIDNLGAAVSLIDVRKYVLQYLREPDKARRSRLLIELRDLEGGTAERVAQLLRLMKPPLPLPAESQVGVGEYELTTSAPGIEAGVRYLVQLPPEYDPLRRYPAIVTLCGLDFSPEQQMSFWAGGRAEVEVPDDQGGTQKTTLRRGQATRHGYITIAVDWHRPEQFEYEFSAREHAAVLSALRDAMRRLAIDTDRIFLTGHDMGGDAAWDMGLAHPDLWAGVMPMLARSGKYMGWYWENAQYVPWYFVAGEMDGGKVADSARELDRYLKSPKFDMTLAEYQGRGHEPLSDEILRLFDWMSRKRRSSAPEEFETFTMRPWDNFFWWVELEGLPNKHMVLPELWPPERGTHAFRVRTRKGPKNNLDLFSRAARTTVWLSPELVDFDKPIEVELNGRRIADRSNPPAPDIGVLLEDVRTRGDRLRPFWAKVEGP